MTPCWILNGVQKPSLLLLCTMCMSRWVKERGQEEVVIAKQMKPSARLQCYSWPKRVTEIYSSTAIDLIGMESSLGSFSFYLNEHLLPLGPQLSLLLVFLKIPLPSASILFGASLKKWCLCSSLNFVCQSYSHLTMPQDICELKKGGGVLDT